MTAPSLRRHGVTLVPESARVIVRPFIPSSPLRITTIIGRALALSEEEALRELAGVLKDFDARHFDLELPLLANYLRVVPHLFTQQPISHARKLLIGALFSGEYALESAALFNPSMVPHPDQDGTPEGALRFIMSLRATGEGHISSVEFRSGLIAADGGILIKGPNIFKGYYRDAEATLETLVDGWLHTGDLGRLDEDGFLFITGRAKDIIITAGGKNITPANPEHALRHNRWISQAVVLGDGRPYLVALITLDPEEAPAFAREHDLELDEVYRSELMRAEIQTAIDAVNSHYAPVEQIKRFEILPKDFSQPTGELTPTLKVKRSIVQQKYAETIDAIYRSPSDRTTQPTR